MGNARKRNKKTLSIYKLVAGLGLLLLVLFLSTFGFLGSLKAASTDINIKVCYPPIAPTINSPQDNTQTTNSSIILSGSASANKVVYAYRNSAQVGFVTSSNDGSFSISISLSQGSNELYVSTKNECNETASSGSVTVQRQAINPPPANIPPASGTSSPSTSKNPASRPPSAKTELPGPHESNIKRPVILEPKNGTRVTRPTILVKGVATPLTKVRLLLNNRQVAEVLSNDKGEFIVSVNLKRGENILIASIDEASGALFSTPVLVSYEPGLLTTAKSSPILLTMVIIGILIILMLVEYFIRRTKLGRRLWLGLKSHKRNSNDSA